MNPKILVADQDLQVLGSLRRMLWEFEQVGVEILEVTDGEVALEMIQTQRPRLVLLDIVLGDVNGFFVCHTVKREWNLNVHVALMTARYDDFNRQRGLRCGADAYLTKPLEASDIFKQVDAALRSVSWRDRSDSLNAPMPAYRYAS